MIRLLFYLAIASGICRLATGRWPWQLMGWELPAGPARSSDKARARALLGVARNADRPCDRVVARRRVPRADCSDERLLRELLRELAVAAAALEQVAVHARQRRVVPGPKRSLVEDHTVEHPGNAALRMHGSHRLADDLPHVHSSRPRRAGILR